MGRSKPSGLALLLLVAGCGSPHTYGVGYSHGRGDITGGGKPEGYDTEEDAVELTLYGDLLGGPQRRSERLTPVPCPYTHYSAAPPTALPAKPHEGSSLPWEEILWAGIGALGLKGGQVGRQKIQTHRSRKKTATPPIVTS